MIIIHKFLKDLTKIANFLYFGLCVFTHGKNIDAKLFPLILTVLTQTCLTTVMSSEKECQKLVHIKCS